MRTATVCAPSRMPVTTAWPVPEALVPLPVPITTSTPGTRTASVPSSWPFPFWS